MWSVYSFLLELIWFKDRCRRHRRLSIVRYQMLQAVYDTWILSFQHFVIEKFSNINRSRKNHVMTLMYHHPTSAIISSCPILFHLCSTCTHDPLPSEHLRWLLREENMVVLSRSSSPANFAKSTVKTIDRLEKIKATYNRDKVDILNVYKLLKRETERASNSLKYTNGQEIWIVHRKEMQMALKHIKIKTLSHYK